MNHLSALPLFADYYDAMGFDTDNLVVAVSYTHLDVYKRQASPLRPRMHLPSHWFSCGHTRPQTEEMCIRDSH